jgi:hypothetical protein
LSFCERVDLQSIELIGVNDWIKGLFVIGGPNPNNNPTSDIHHIEDSCL